MFNENNFILDVFDSLPAELGVVESRFVDSHQDCKLIIFKDYPFNGSRRAAIADAISFFINSNTVATVASDGRLQSDDYLIMYKCYPDQEMRKDIFGKYLNDLVINAVEYCQVVLEKDFTILRVEDESIYKKYEKLRADNNMLSDTFSTILNLRVGHIVNNLYAHLSRSEEKLAIITIDEVIYGSFVEMVKSRGTSFVVIEPTKSSNDSLSTYRKHLAGKPANGMEAMLTGIPYENELKKEIDKIKQCWNNRQFQQCLELVKNVEAAPEYEYEWSCSNPKYKLESHYERTTLKEAWAELLNLKMNFHLHFERCGLKKVWRVWKHPCGRHIETLSMTDNGHLYLGDCKGSIEMRDTDSGNVCESFKISSKSISATCYVPERNMLLIGDSDGMLRIFSIGNKEIIGEFNTNEDDISRIAYAKRDGCILVASPLSSDICRWNIDSLIQCDSFPKLWQDIYDNNQIEEKFKNICYIDDIVITSDNLRLYASDACDRILCSWDYTTGELIKAVDSDAGIQCMALFNGWKKLVTGCIDDYQIRIWDCDTLVCEKELKGHCGPIGSILITSDNNYLISASGTNTGGTGQPDQTFKIWDISTEKAIGNYTINFSNIQNKSATNRGISSMVMTSESRYLFLAVDNSIEKWEIDWDWKLRN